jgi:hypothetical protein
VRFPDWPQRLAATLEAARTRTFSYGGFDCALFAADCVKAISGVDYAANLRGYRTQTEAYRIIAAHGGLEELLTSLLGAPIHTAFAQRGDVVLAEIPVVEQEGLSVGVCLGAFCAFPAGVGLTQHPRTVAKVAWRIA